MIQLHLLENIIKEISTDELKKLPDNEAQLSRYFAFMSFAILATAAAGNHIKALGELKEKIVTSPYSDKIKSAKFKKVSVKSKITLFLMKNECYKAAFYFLNLCEKIKIILRRG